MKIAIIINPQRMSDELKTKLEGDELKKKYAINYDIFTPDPDDIPKILDKINIDSYNAVVIGGGDGTVRTAIQSLVTHEVPVIILPLGTFNVLAKSLEYTNDIDQIFAIIKNNKTKKIDLAEVNGNIIVNHAWLGFYYYILKLREKHKGTLGKSRLLKAFFNMFIMFKHIPYFYFEVNINNKVQSYKTCLIFVSNNESSSNVFSFGERVSLNSGYLSVSILHCHTRWQLFLCMWSVAFGNFKNSKYIIHFSVPELTVSSKNEVVNAVIDGETFKLDSPLHFILHPKQLTVFTP